MLNCFIKVMNPIFKEAINLYEKGQLEKAQKICLEVVKFYFHIRKNKDPRSWGHLLQHFFE